MICRLNVSYWSGKPYKELLVSLKDFRECKVVLEDLFDCVEAKEIFSGSWELSGLDVFNGDTFELEYKEDEKLLVEVQKVSYEELEELLKGGKTLEDFQSMLKMVMSLKEVIN